MGFTRYWTFKKGSEKNYQKALTEIRKIIIAKKSILAGGDGEGAPEIRGKISFNGKGDEDSHESFFLALGLKENEDFNFCKTAQKPYDVVVSACLCVLAYRLGTGIEVSVDGDYEDWVAGAKLATKVLGIKIPNPKDPTSVVFIKEAENVQAS
jgi:hypothetical protein